MRLGQVHRSRPAPGDHVRHIGRLLLVGALRQDRGDRTGGQAVIHFEGLVGRQHIFADRCRHDMGQALPAKLLGRRQRRPAAVAILLIRRFEPGRRGHRPVGVAGAAFLVPDPVERCQHFARKPSAFGKDGLDQVTRRRAKARQVRIVGKADDVVEHILRVAHGGGVAGHVYSFAEGSICLMKS